MSSAGNPWPDRQLRLVVPQAAQKNGIVTLGTGENEVPAFPVLSPDKAILQGSQLTEHKGAGASPAHSSWTVLVSSSCHKPSSSLVSPQGHCRPHGSGHAQHKTCLGLMPSPPGHCPGATCPVVSLATLFKTVPSTAHASTSPRSPHSASVLHVPHVPFLVCDVCPLHREGCFSLSCSPLYL